MGGLIVVSSSILISRLKTNDAQEDDVPKNKTCNAYGYDSEPSARAGWIQEWVGVPSSNRAAYERDE